MLIVLALAAAVLSDDPDGVVTTARQGDGAVMLGAEAPTTDARPDAAQVTAVTPHNLSTREQIDRWVSARSTDARPFAEEAGPVDDRQMHGFVDASIGTDDYSAVTVGVSLPIGEKGRLDMTYSQSKNGYGYPGYGYGAYGYPGEYGYGPGDYGYGYQGRPFAPAYVTPGRSRSLSMRYSWDDDSRGERAPMRGAGITAED